MELEERTIEQLPDRCQNCGAKLTDAEKETALTEGRRAASCCARPARPRWSRSRTDDAEAEA